MAVAVPRRASRSYEAFDPVLICTLQGKCLYESSILKLPTTYLGNDIELHPLSFRVLLTLMHIVAKIRCQMPSRIIMSPGAEANARIDFGVEDCLN